MRRSSGLGAVAAAGLILVGAVAPAAAGPQVLPGSTTVPRLAGADRYETAVKISAHSHPGRADDVFVVNGTSWPDGLSAGAAAADVDGVLLPVRSDAVPTVIANEIERLQPKRIWIVGGPDVLSATVLQELTVEAVVPRRLAGANRFATAALVAQQFFDMTKSGAYYASGASFADALAGGAAAAHTGVPLLLTDDPKPADTPVAPGSNFALGGSGVLSDPAVIALHATRIGGADRFATAVALSARTFPTSSTAYLVDGLDFADALAATPAAAHDHAPVLLTRPECIGAGTVAELARLKTTTRVIVGGTQAVGGGAANLNAVCDLPPIPGPIENPGPPGRPRPPALPGSTTS